MYTHAELTARATEARRQREAVIKRIVEAGRVLECLPPSAKPAEVLAQVADTLEARLENEAERAGSR